MHPLLQLGIELHDTILGTLALRDVFREQDDSAELGSIEPRANIPANPMHPAVRALIPLFPRADDLARQPTAMHGSKMLGKIGKHFVVREPAQGSAGQAIVTQPAATGRDVAHVTIEHGDRDGRLVDEQTQMLFVVTGHGSSTR